MEKHFINTIEINNFKCFKDFKADGFGRVNLIGGKNNVGKTAFMEACFLGMNTKKQRDFFHSLLVIELNRNPLKEFDIVNNTNNFDFKFDESIININDKKCSISNPFFPDALYEIPQKTYNDGVKEFLDFYQGKDKPLNIKNHSFISQTSMRQNYIINCIDSLKLLQKWDYLNKVLNEEFKIEKIDVIQSKVMLLKDGKFIELSEFGDGLKQFIAIFLSMYLNPDKVVFLDEIENGIHYTLLDDLWKIILTISKEQNVQVFATTHSKECIESYTRIAKKLEDKDIKYIKLSRQKDSSIYSGVRDYDMLQYSIDDEHEVR
ncbi:MAG: AAA family ATPase [Arcobacteraceae bacterium]|jgi:AAA15 family ATPase/GTPase|nr:AAA family ATPase [Arcobacteraceae bacterium]